MKTFGINQNGALRGLLQDNSAILGALLSSASILALASALTATPAQADCTVTTTSANCGVSPPNPYPGPSIGSGPATASGFVVTVDPNAQINITSPSVNQNAITLSDNATITIGSGALVQNNVTQGGAVGPYNTGWNTVEFRNNNTLTNYGTIISNGTSNNAEPINPQGANNTITNYGTVRAVRSGLNAMYFENTSGRNYVVNYGLIAVSSATGDAVGGKNFAASSASIDFTNIGTVYGSLKFGGGDDILRLYTGQSITGSVDGGLGFNRLFLNGNGTDTLGPFSRFQTIYKDDPGIWIANSTITDVQLTTVHAGTFAIGDAAHPGAVLTSTNVSVETGGKFGGYGSVTGNVANAGTVAGGNAIAEFAGGPSGNFTINGDLANSGTVNLAGTGVPGNSVTVNGNYAGTGGALLNVRTVLAGDGSPSDRLVIAGGAATGSTGIRVTNAGGAGALTTGDGIMVVQAANGATTVPGAFKLTGPVSAGPYDYLLFRGGVSPGSQDSWYLRSAAQPSPEVPESPFYRPEVALQSAVPSTSLMLARLALGTFNERQGDQLLLRSDRAPGAWGRVFGQQTRESYGQGAQPDFHGSYGGFQAGHDFLQLATADGHADRAGLYLAYSRASGNVYGSVDGNVGASAGRLDLEANNVGGYWTHIGPSNWYIDAVLQGSFINGSTTSDRQLSAGNYARAITASLEGGYPVLLAPWLVLEPQAQVIWQRLWMNDAFDPVSSITFSHPEAVTGRFGTLLRGTFGDPAAIWQPYLKGNVWFGGNGTDIVTFATTLVPVQRNHGAALEGGGGITGRLTQFISVYADASYLGAVSGEQWTALKGNVGLRITW